MEATRLEELYTALAQGIPESQIRRHEPVAGYTTFRIGGPADILIAPTTQEELAFVRRTLSAFGYEPTILGGGSNVLVRDGGIRGPLLCLGELCDTLIARDGIVIASAGQQLKEVSQFAYREGLTGLEFAVGIPGTLGGAIFMNAGAYGGEMQHVVEKVRTLDAQGQLHEYDNASCDFSYRHSRFQESDEVVVEVDLRLQPGNPEEIAAVMTDLTEKRESKQPLEFASAGSTFKRPPGYFAGTLIDETGLKGLRVGDAQVSEKHAGFVINRGQATAADVLGLIREVQRRIQEAHGVALETEVRILGEE